MFDTFIGGAGAGSGSGSALPLILGSQASPKLIVAGTGLVVPSGAAFVVAYVQGSGAAVTVTSLPSITTAGLAVGTMLLVLGTDNTKTVKFQTDTDLSGSKLRINGPVILDAVNAIPLLLGSDGFWRQLGATVK